jgi:GNAT superfamily N-acetyltransferase
VSASVRNPIRIRRARPGAERLLAGLGRTTYRHHFEAIWEPARLRAWLDEQFNRARLARELRGVDVRYDVVWRGSRAVGFAKTIIDSRMPGLRRRGLELQKLYLRRGETGRGTGSRVLAAILRRAQREGARRVWLGALDSNPRARALYERHGFRQVGSLPVDTGRRRQSIHLMERCFPPQRCARAPASKASSARVARSVPSAISSSAR